MQTRLPDSPSLPPRDAVRQVPKPGTLVDLIGYDAAGVPRIVITVPRADVTPELARFIKAWMRRRREHH